MAKLDLGPIGITLDVSPTYLAQAADLERLGYSAIWLAGGQLDSLDRIAEVVRATTAVKVAPGIISLDVYDADAVAGTYADLEATDPGRFLVGLGGPQRSGALAAMGEFLDRLDAAEPAVPVERRILAALGPRKMKLAGERFAGAITLLVTTEYTAQARAQLGDTADLIVDQMAVLETDPERAREVAREPLRFLTTVGGYVANFRRMGFSDKEIEDVSDRLVDELVVWGDVQTIADRVRAHQDAGADHVVIGLLNDADSAVTHSAAAQQIATLLVA